MAKKQALAVSLEEFGLSRYEARAYVALVARGTISAGDLAYHAEIPRTKAYPTLRKLEKKRLAVLSESKPIMCTGVAPEDAFDGIIHEQIDRVNAMNSLVSDLKQASEASRKSRGSEEKRYFQISANNVLDRLRQMIDGAKASMHVTADQWGLGLVSECREQLVSAARRGLEVRIIVPTGQISSEAYRSIPDVAKIRAWEGGCQNCFVFDQTELLFVDGDNGKAAAFSSADVLGSSQIRLFGQMWKSGLRTEPTADMTKAESQEIYRIIRTVVEHGLGHVLNAAYATKDGGPPGMIDLLEKSGISFEGKTLDDVIEIADSALHITGSGRADFDTKNRNISIESKLNSGHSLPWASIIDGYLQNQGYKTRLAYQNSGQRGERVHIKIQQR